MENERKHVSTWTRFWNYPYMLLGLPGGKAFWRPIPMKSATVFGATFLVLLVARSFGIAPKGFKLAFVWHVGVPALAGYVVAVSRTAGKRIDHWVVDHLRYRFGPKVSDRYRAVDPAPVQYTYQERGRGLWRSRKRT